MKDAVPHPPIPAGTKPSSGARGGFTLVEVTIAIGIVAFSMLAVLALLPVGMQTLQDANSDTAMAALAQQIRGELQQSSFNPSNNAAYIQTITSSNRYYTLDVCPTNFNLTNTYYVVHLDAAPISSGVARNFAYTNAQNVTVTVKYPPPNFPKTKVFSLFVARQSAD